MKMSMMLAILAIVMAFVALGAALYAQRLEKAASSRWSVRGSVLLSTGIIIGVTPGVLFPESGAIRITASVVSLAFTAASLVALRFSRREARRSREAAR
jgi:hypothetical protein